MPGKQMNRYEALVENLNDAVYVVDTQTLLFSYVNREGEQLSGYSKKMLHKMHIAKIVAPESLPTVQKMIARKHRDKSTIYEIEIIRKDGERVPVEISSRALYGGNGAPLEILGVARDITERKMAERQRSIFISLVTHEIKNPLTSVGMYLALLQKQVNGNEKAEKYVASMSEQIRTINQFTTDLLDASQMRVGKFQITKDTMSLDEVIDEAIELTASLSHKVEREGKVGRRVMGDKTRVRQVLVNLISNAIKYSPSGDRVRVTAQSAPKEVVIAVQDFGDGIKEEDQKELFDIFVRSSESTRKNILGHGLGLFICQEIIRHHGGRIWLESEPGKGSTFFFTIPR